MLATICVSADTSLLTIMFVLVGAGHREGERVQEDHDRTEYNGNSLILFSANLYVLTVSATFLIYCHVCSGVFWEKRERTYRGDVDREEEQVR